MLTEAQEWRHIIVRLLSFALILAVPIVVTVGWYHGHKARHRISSPEIVIITLLLFITGSVLWWLTKPHQETAAVAPPSVPDASSMRPAAAPEKSIAVLPFVDMSERKDQDYFGDGMAEEVTDLLAKLPQITVIGRTSSFQFKGRNEDLRTIGGQLHAAHVVEGSGRRVGQRRRRA
jgi:adenylate cyclase